MPGYVGLIRCPSSEVLCSNDRLLPSTVRYQSRVSHQQLLVTTTVDNVTSSVVHSDSEFVVFDLPIYIPVINITCIDDMM